MLINGFKIVINRANGQNPTVSVRSAGNNGSSTYTVIAPAIAKTIKQEVVNAVRASTVHHEAHRQSMIAEDAAMAGKYPTE